MKLVKVEAVLMDNNELLRNGKSLWFVKEWEKGIEVVMDYDA